MCLDVETEGKTRIKSMEDSLGMKLGIEQLSRATVGTTLHVVAVLRYITQVSALAVCSEHFSR